MMKRYDSYKDSGVDWIGEIPSGWELKKLKHISDVRPSNVDKHIYEEEIQVHLCNYTDVYYNEVINSKTNLKRGSCNENELEKFKLEKGDVIITKDSETPDDIGIPVYVEETLKNVVCGYHLTMIKSISVMGKFIFRFIECDRTKRYFELNSNGVTRFGLGKSSIENLVLPIPSDTEQQQIVSFLDTKTTLIDSLIEKTQRKIELLKEKRTSLINEVVTKGLNPNVEMKDSGVEWVGEIPSHWVLSKVMYVLEFHNNVRIPLSSEDRGKRQGEYRYYGSTGIIDYIDDYLFDGEYILIGEDGSNLRLRTYRLSNVVSGKFWVNNHSHILRSRDGNNHYYSHLLELTDFSNYITGSTQPKLTMDNLKIVPMISPPLSEQQQIVEYLDEQTQLIDNTISIEEKRIELLKEYRQSLISEVVTGKLKVINNG